MKTLTFLVSLIFAVSLKLHAEGGSVRLDVVQNVKTNSGGANGTTTQSRTLVITLNNTSKTPMDNLTLKYWFFDRDMKGGNLGVHKAGEGKVSLVPVGKQVFTTDIVTGTYTAQHSEVSNNNNVRGQNGQQINVPSIKRVEASGKKIVAHAVRVFDGEKMVAEYYSEYSLKQKMGDPNAALKTTPVK